MTYRTVMVSLSPGRDCRGVVGAAMGVSRQFGSILLGRAFCRPIHCICGDFSVPAPLFEEDRKQIDRHLRESEADFRSTAASYDKPIDWKGESNIESLSERFAREAAAADIIVARVPNQSEPPDATRQPDLCDLVMQAGRPVLLVPESCQTAEFHRIIIGWKDTREARRAVGDALPLLVKARNVLIAGIFSPADENSTRDGVAHVSGWLARHGIAAEQRVIAAEMANAAQLTGLAQKYGADLIVAGAYGDNRQGRWTLGGITSELLSGRRCVLLSH